MTDCIFCKIVTKQIPAQILYEDDEIIAIPDIDPKAPIHLLILPKKHIRTLNDVHQPEQNLIGKMIGIAIQLAKEKNIADAGYRLVFNCNQQGGQAVFHIHLHVLGGREMQWPPG